MFDRGPHVSFANCGLPYYVGDVIRDEQDLLVATPELFADRFHIDIRCRNEVLAVDRQARVLKVRDLTEGRDYDEPYDALVLSPGAAPVRPPLPGIDLPGVFALRSIPDSQRIRDWITEKTATRAVIVGGGFIGLEMTENLVHRGLSVTLIEKLPQVMAVLDAEMVTPVHRRLREAGVDLRLGEGVAEFQQLDSGCLGVLSDAGALYEADLVILAIGVRPETSLARDAGLEIGELGGIRTDAQMRTSDPHIWAVGDAVEVRDVVTGEYTLIPLAGPANRQGRIAADSIFGRSSRFRGVQGTAVCGLFDLTIACTGASERTLRRLGKSHEKVYLHPGHHVGYYPGSTPIDMKLLYDAEDGLILGAQAVGAGGVDKRIDVIATGIQKDMTIYDLEECELCYAPQFGAAKDPVNLAGMVAGNALRGDAPLAYWEDQAQADVLLLDVCDADEFAEGHVPGAANIPLNELRGRLAELPRDRAVWVYCQVGQRAYYATRLLRLSGFDAFNLTGGVETYLAMQGECAD